MPDKEQEKTVQDANRAYVAFIQMAGSTKKDTDILGPYELLELGPGRQRGDSDSPEWI
jgi:hypothetical protein